jgi:hypothetical protein
MFGGRHASHLATLLGRAWRDFLLSFGKEQPIWGIAFLSIILLEFLKSFPENPDP